jgi:glycerophosphoryl diester phosphodiesterase
LLVEEPVVVSMHEAGRLVSTWTVDETDWMKTMIDAGVDAIVSNRISRLRAVLDTR